MATRKKASKRNSRPFTKARKGGGAAKCVALADRGIKTGKEFATVFSALIGDIATERIDARSANAICNAGGKLLKVVEMQHKYGKSAAKEALGSTTLRLT